MEKQTNIVVIVNHTDGNKALAVKNFSDENVKQAVSKLLDIKPKDLKCSASSMNSGNYRVTKHYRSLKDKLHKLEGLESDKDVLVELNYATLFV